MIGERWTLLIVRELLVAPRRYGELLDNLAGIGTNLLADRLREMELNGLVDKQGTKYVLTEAGRLLEPVVWEIVRFGLALGIADTKDRLTRPEWDSVALRALYDEGLGEQLSGRYVIEMNAVPYCIDRRGREVTISQGDAHDTVARVALSKKTARSLAAGDIKLNDAKVKIDGSRREARNLLRAFGLLPA